MNLAQLADVIWPGGVRLHGSGAESYVVLPSVAEPRLLVPLGAPRAAAAAVRYSVEARGWKRRALAGGFRLGVAGLGLRGRLVVEHPEQGLREHLSAVLGEPAVMAIQLGPARANRKPVAPVLRADGSLLGYAKLGVNELTSALVDAEALALAKLGLAATLGPVKVAAVRHHGQWNGMPLLVQQALPVWEPRARPEVAADAERAAQVAVARSLGTRVASYVGSDYAGRLVERLAALPPGPDVEQLAAALDAVADAEPVLEFGAWHGDWNGGNSAVLRDGRVLIWDWERFDADVPVGFDALHLALQTSAGDPRRAASDLLTGASMRLAPFGVPAREAASVAVLYLVELAVRYLHDRQDEAGARLGRVREWLLPALEGHLALVAAPGRLV